MSKATENVLGKSPGSDSCFLSIWICPILLTKETLIIHNPESDQEKTGAVRKLELVFCLQIVVIEKRMKVDEKYMQKGKENIMGKRLRININRWN